MPNKLKIVLSLSFILTFSALSFSQEDLKPKSGSGSGIGNGDSQKTVQTEETATGIRILSKPRSNYTDAARKNGIEGDVRLRVIFLSSGEIGSISPVTTLPDGLTEQAIAAARQIKFIPATKSGVPVSVAKLVEYRFSIYYKENDDFLEKNAEIIEMPDPERPQMKELNSFSGKIRLEIILLSDGETAHILKIYSSNLPRQFEIQLTPAVSKIKFKPAIHKNGNAVSQTKEIEYEFKAQKN